MHELRLRSMTPEEFAAFRARAVSEYARAHVQSGEWLPEDAERLAAEETDSLLPRGLDTPGMLLLFAETEEHGIVGMTWLALARSDRPGGWIYDIEVVPERRGEGFGRALLEAVERLVAEHGVESLGLNVFADNGVARGLYDACGYEATSLHMIKRLAAAPTPGGGRAAGARGG
jgi:ribosomal protein S18 acetylase RimI-like enzyme